MKRAVAFAVRLQRIVIYAAAISGLEEVLYHQVMVAWFGALRCPAKRTIIDFTYASFVGGTFTTVERIVLDMQ